MNINKYWNDINLRLDKLVSAGYVKLPRLDFLDLNTIADNIKDEMNGETFCELCPRHESFLKELNLANCLTPKLYEIARNTLGYKGNLENQYHIARLVKPADSKENYRAHFDSHLFTLVIPLKIPLAQNSGSVGDLIYFPNARNRPKNEFSNFIGKVYHKKYASKEGMNRFATNHTKLTEDFQDYSPLLFMGNTTLHANKSVSIDCSSYRLTLLAHFFDPSPRYGIGSIARLLRAR